jgi:cytidylate kinase
MEERIQRVKELLKQEKQAYQADINLRRAAQDVIVTRDFASADYIQQYYAVDWADPLLYHMVLNTAKVTTVQAAHLIVELMKMQESEPA